MDEMISGYYKLIAQLEEEYENITKCFQDELLEKYKELLLTERKKIQKMLRSTY